MIKLLNVISGLNNAGTEAVVMNYYRNMDRKAIQFDFLVLNEGEGFYEKEIESLGGNIYKIPSFLSDPLRNIRLRKKFFKEHKYDIVEVHTPSVLRYGYCQLAKKSGAKVIFHLHNSQKVNSIIKRIALSKLSKCCDEIVTCSQYAAINALGREADRVVCNAIDFDKFKFDLKTRNDIRKNLGFQVEDYIIGHIGRFSRVKNQLFLISLMQKLKANKNIKLILKGFGEDEDLIKTEILSQGLQNQITLIKNEYEAYQLYNAFDIFVLPSILEGLPVVSIEAQANGLYVIASDKVTDEIKVTPRVERIELSETVWLETLLKKEAHIRQNVNLEDWKQTGYEIRTAAAQRFSGYQELLKK